MTTLLHIGVCVGSESLPRYFDKQTSYSEFYLNRELKERLENLDYVPEYIFLQIQGDNYDGNRSTLELMPSLRRLKDKGSFIINWTGDKRNGVPEWMRTFKDCVSVTCFSNEEDVNAFGEGAKFLQIGIDEAIFTPLGDKLENKDIVFQGNSFSHFPLSGKRKMVVQELQFKYGNRFGVYGNGWPNVTGNSNGDQRKEAAIYRGAKIALNVSHYDSERYTSDRMFRILGSGCFCLSHYYKGIEKDFEVGKHLATFTDIFDMKRKIDYYLEHEDERKQIADEGHKHCYANFTYTNMVDSILKLKQ